MLYVKIIHQTPAEYPYSHQKLREDNPQTSFPETMSDERLADWNVYPVTESTRPADDYTKNIEEGNPVLTDGVWTQNWVVTDATQQEINERVANKWTEIREQRTQILYSCDWTQLSDSPVDKVAWATYRQQLRDITSQLDPFNITWPVAPS